MNPIPDSFEWRVLHRTFLGLCMLFVVLYTTAVVSQHLPDQLQYPNLGLVLVLRLIGLFFSVLALMVTLKMKADSSWLFPLALSSTIFHFVISMAVLTGSGGNIVLGQGSLLLISPLFVLMVGFFSKSQWITALFGLGLLALTFFLFSYDPSRYFYLVLSSEEEVKYMTQILYFAIPTVTFFVFLNNQIAATLTGQARKAAETLSRIAFYDVDTDLPNARKLEKDIAAWRQENLPAGYKFVLAGMRLEGLDGLNESQGLEYTTQMVQRVARGCAEGLKVGIEEKPQFRPPEGLAQLYRIEGSTFLFSLTIPPGTRPEQGPFQGLIQELLTEENRKVSLGHPLGFRGGFTLFPDDSDSPAQLVRNLLNLLHTRAQTGLGQFHPFNPKAYQESVRREQIKEALAQAVHNSEVFTMFQPKVRLSDESLSGFEALARWNSASLGPISPAEFIPLAEQYGLIEALTTRTLKQTLGLVMGLLERGRRDFRVSINLSPGLLTPRFLESIYQECESTRLAHYLELEITEGILMVLDPAITQHFRRLRTLGVTFSIDDFGTGYSNLGYLQNFEAEVLKVDKRFIDGIPGDAKNSKLVRAILQMAQSFDMKVVAEGVEYAEQKQFLAEIGCDQIQGYYYSKPLLLEAALEYTPKIKGV